MFHEQQQKKQVENWKAFKLCAEGSTMFFKKIKNKKHLSILIPFIYAEYIKKYKSNGLFIFCYFIFMFLFRKRLQPLSMMWIIKIPCHKLSVYISLFFIKTFCNIKVRSHLVSTMTLIQFFASKYKIKFYYIILRTQSISHLKFIGESFMNVWYVMIVHKCCIKWLYLNCITSRDYKALSIFIELC